MSRFNDLTGRRFGRLVVDSLAGKNKRGNPMWLCKCECGNTCVVNGHNLLRNHSTSCGCFHRERFCGSSKTHGMRNTRLYRTWAHMRGRCYNPNDKRYPQYGGRGINVCDDWRKSFISFYEWAMANGYQDNLTIDRIDVNGNYDPTNCRWVTIEAQASNKRNNRVIIIDGEARTLSQWLSNKNIKKGTFYDRIRKGWSEEEALTTPVGGGAK